MARPQKQTVDYFPHDANASNGDTLTILESQFGNDGYAFWFKLLERVSTTENHVIDAKNSVKWQILLAKCHLTAETAENIMRVLADLDAIDADLWRSDRLIWCQNFVDGIADAYRKRKHAVPTRPVSNARKPVSGADNSITTAINPQTKLNKTKLNKNNKHPFGEFQNVLLTSEELEKLNTRFGKAQAGQLIETLSQGIKSKGYKYKDHYATILAWQRRDDKLQNNGGKGTKTLPTTSELQKGWG